VNFTHLDENGNINMVDVGNKPPTKREAVASGEICVGEEIFTKIKTNQIAKGNVLECAKIAGIMAAKKTHELIPLCHQICLDKVDISFSFDEKTHTIKAQSLARTNGQTGVEMEALIAVSVALTTVYDMCKALSKSMIISDIKLLSKSGGKSGDYVRQI